MCPTDSRWALLSTLTFSMLLLILGSMLLTFLLVLIIVSFIKSKIRHKVTIWKGENGLIAGSSDQRRLVDGRGDQARFYRINTISVDTNGVIYAVCNESPNRKIYPLSNPFFSLFFLFPVLSFFVSFFLILSCGYLFLYFLLWLIFVSGIQAKAPINLACNEEDVMWISLTWDDVAQAVLPDPVSFSFSYILMIGNNAFSLTNSNPGNY